MVFSVLMAFSTKWILQRVFRTLKRSMGWWFSVSVIFDNVTNGILWSRLANFWLSADQIPSEAISNLGDVFKANLLTRSFTQWSSDILELLVPLSNSGIHPSYEGSLNLLIMLIDRLDPFLLRCWYQSCWTPATLNKLINIVLSSLWRASPWPLPLNRLHLHFCSSSMLSFLILCTHSQQKTLSQVLKTRVGYFENAWYIFNHLSTDCILVEY